MQRSCISLDKAASFLITERTFDLIYIVLISIPEEKKALRKEQRRSLRGEKNILYLQIISPSKTEAITNLKPISKLPTTTNCKSQPRHPALHNPSQWGCFVSTAAYFPPMQVQETLAKASLYMDTDSQLPEVSHWLNRVNCLCFLLKRL